MERTEKDVIIKSTDTVVEASENAPNEKTVYDGLHEIAVSLDNIAKAINNGNESVTYTFGF